MTAPVMQRHVVPNRLAQLIDRPGGKTAEQALEQASALVEELRDTCVQAILSAVARLEALVAAAGPVVLTDVQAAATLTLTDRVITLAATYGYHAMDAAGRSLADVVNAMGDRRAVRLEPIKVHVRAMRLLAPCAPHNPAIATVLASELTKVRAHLNA